MASGPPQKKQEVIKELGEELETLNKAIEATIKKQSAAEKDPDKADALKKELASLLKRVELTMKTIERLQGDLAKNI